MGRIGKRQAAGFNWFASAASGVSRDAAKASSTDLDKHDKTQYESSGSNGTLAQPGATPQRGLLKEDSSKRTPEEAASSRSIGLDPGLPERSGHSRLWVLQSYTSV